MLTSEKFFLFCQTHRELRIERTASGKIIIMPPADGETGARNADLVTELGIWARINNQGKVFGSSTALTCPMAQPVRRTPLGCAGNS